MARFFGPERSHRNPQGMDHEQVWFWQDFTQELLTEVPTAVTDDEPAQNLAGRLKAQVMQLFNDPGTRFEVDGCQIRNWGETAEDDMSDADWRDIKAGYFESDFSVYPGGRVDLGTESVVHKAVRAATILERLPLLKAFAHETRRIIDGSYDQDKAEFGNKYANVKANEIMANRLNAWFGQPFRQPLYEVAPYSGIPVWVYTAYQTHRDIAPLLAPYMAWVEAHDSNGYWVRSSATVAEDAATTSGAGMYESVFVEAGQGMAGLYSAVETVYESVDAPQAQAHRRDQQLEQPEQMGLVLHQHVTHEEKFEAWGYSNGVVPGVAELSEVFWQVNKNAGTDHEKNRQLFYRNMTMLDLAKPIKTYGPDWDEQLADAKAPYFKPDAQKVTPQGVLLAAYLSGFAELVYGRPVQQEFVWHNGSIYPLQTRPLTADFLKNYEEFKGFPEEPFLYQGRALGVANGLELKPIKGDRVYDYFQANTYLADAHTYAAIFESNISMHYITLPMIRGLGAVIVLHESSYRDYAGNGSHMETLCAESGIPCSFAVTKDRDGEEVSVDTIFKSLMGRKSFRLYMDGLESRIY